MEIREPVGSSYNCVIYANEHEWKLLFDIPPPDRRYSASTVTVRPNEVPHLASCVKELFAKYETLKPIVTGKAEVSDRLGHVWMKVGGAFEGVFLGNIRFTDINTVRDFGAAMEAVPRRAEELVKALRRAVDLPTDDIRGRSSSGSSEQTGLRLFR